MPVVKLKGPFRLLHSSCSPNLPRYFQVSHLMPPKQSTTSLPKCLVPFQNLAKLNCSQLFFKWISQTQLNAPPSSLWPVPKKPNSSGYCYEHLWGTSVALPWTAGKTIVTGQESSAEKLESKKKNLKSIETEALAQSLYWAGSGGHLRSALSTAGSKKGPELTLGPDALHQASQDLLIWEMQSQGLALL